MTPKITIYKDENCEMMKIVYNEKTIFEGNYWDFERHPDNIAKFLKKLKVSVGVQEYEFE
jgi:hypothetical protein